MKKKLILLIVVVTALSGHVTALEKPSNYPPSARPDRVILNITEDPATTMAVTWRTDTTVSETVAWLCRNIPGVLNADSALAVTGRSEDITADGITARFHSVIFTGLVPGTGYAYSVGSGADASEWFTFRTTETGAAPFSFLWFGDSQVGPVSSYARVIRQAYRSVPEAAFMIFTGDLVDGGYANITLDDEWGDWHLAAGFIASEVPVVATPGNHEFYDPKDRQKRNLNMFWRPGFTLPENGPAGLEETAYSFDYLGVRFIIVSSDEMLRDEAIARSQTEWVESLLKDNPCKWTVMAFHHPFFSTAARRDNKVVRENLKPLVDRYRVDLVLNGHDHTYARGMIKPDGIEPGDKTAGTVYVVSVSGSKQYRQDAEPWWQVGYTNTQLWQAIAIDGNRLIYKAFDASGNLVDQFMLTKKKNGLVRIGLPQAAKTK
ncbi:MAG: metallophosphoesterase family protein [Bacteroidales bacterium]|nr:metallophosphoesterase family protein [Bacteroidales bacterium]